MINAVSFSGGRTSAFMVYQMEAKRKAGEINNLHYIFMDTGAEHPATYDFVRNVVADTGIDLVCLRAKMSKEKGKGVRYQVVSIDDIGPDLKPWKDMLECYGAPKTVTPWCTARMKSDPHTWYIRDTFGDQDVTTWLGIRADEPRRLKPKDGFRYLAEISDFEKQDINEWWADMPYDLELKGDHLGNCVFCIKKGVNRVALAVRDEPELAQEFIKLLDTTDMHIPAGQQARLDEGTATPLHMYRGNTTLKQIIKTYSDQGRDQIAGRMRANTDACAESCEVFVCDLEQKELF